MPKTDSALLCPTPDAITDAWLTAVLDRPVTITETNRIGTGQMSVNVRVRFNGPGGTGSVVVKVASDDERSRATGIGMGAYYREVAFYQNLAPRLPHGLPVCHLAVHDATDGWFTLVLEDVDAPQGDQIAGCTPEQARIAMRQLARLHAPVFNDLSVGASDYLNIESPLTQSLMAALLPGFVAQYADQLTEEQIRICETYVAVADAHSADRRPPLGLIHGDFRLDNILFGSDTCTVVDWQTLTWGPAMLDAAYFLGGALDPDERQEHERSLVRAYHEELLANGVANFDWETCWEEYRRQTVWALAMVIIPAMMVGRTDRGDEMFMTLLRRVCRQITDLDALSLLPEPGSAPAALVPTPADENLHAPGGEQSWNESWYFDVASVDGSTGAYVRLGRLPNQHSSLVTVAIVRNGLPSVLCVDTAAPLPVGDIAGLAVTGTSCSLRLACAEPLQRYEVEVVGLGASFTDPAAPLRGEPGEPVPIRLDLTWTTDGTPYQWRAGTRYEIPCHVTGTITVGELTLDIDAPGQRDHSWGARDWWSADWMWSAFHFEDGTRFHAVTLPDVPGLAFGYVQRDGEVRELSSGTTEQSFTDDGLVTHAIVATQPGSDKLDVTPIAWGALRMDGADGQVSFFPRAMAEVVADDGRRGIGWIEWNVVQH